MPLPPIPTHPRTALGDHRRFPGCRLLLACSVCGWSKSYSVERVILRLRELKAGGHATTLDQVARRVGWDCPACHRARWRCQFGWPPGLNEREARRLQNLYRN